MSLYKEIERTLLEGDHKPLLGNAPPFPWEDVRAQLKKHFELDELRIEVRAPEWKESFGHGLQLYFQFTDTPLLWRMENEDARKFASLLLGTESLTDTTLLEGLIQFCALEVLRSLELAHFPAFQFLENKPELKGPFLTYDIEIGSGDHSAHGQLILPSAFHRQWIAYFADQEPHLSEERKQSLRIKVGLEVGRTDLSYSEWKSVKEGDFISLDTCHIDPKTNEGEVTLSVHGKALLRGQLTAEGVEL